MQKYYWFYWRWWTEDTSYKHFLKGRPSLHSLLSQLLPQLLQNAALHCVHLETELNRWHKEKFVPYWYSQGFLLSVISEQYMQIFRLLKWVGGYASGYLLNSTESSANSATLQSSYFKLLKKYIKQLDRSTDPWDTRLLIYLFFEVITIYFLSFNHFLIHDKPLPLTSLLFIIFNILLWGTFSKAFWNPSKLYPLGHVHLLPY